MSSDYYKEQIEKIAQSRWRKHIDNLSTEDELYDFASETSKNRRQIFNKPGNLKQRNNIGFDKEEIKRILSSEDGYNYS